MIIKIDQWLLIYNLVKSLFSFILFIFFLICVKLDHCYATKRVHLGFVWKRKECSRKDSKRNDCWRNERE